MQLVSGGEGQQWYLKHLDNNDYSISTQNR